MSPKTKSTLHVRNRNRVPYDLTVLQKAIPDLAQYIQLNKHGNESIDFSNPVAVKLLNKALLYHYYGIEYWNFPDKNLCPPIPGRADYIHHIADLLFTDKDITCLDIGTGASCIYPIIGVVEYDWDFVATDIDEKSIASAQKIVANNQKLKGKVTCKLQPDKNKFFEGIVAKDEKIDISICNPPFHASIEEAQKGTRRKVKNLTGKSSKEVELNFAGVSNELVCKGGEALFIKKMIKESKHFATNFYWFSTLVSKQENLKNIYKILKLVKAKQVKTIALATGNKTSRIVAWTFLDIEEQKQWKAQKEK